VQVLDPFRASYGVENALYAVTQLAQVGGWLGRVGGWEDNVALLEGQLSWDCLWRCSSTETEPARLPALL
jgi:hypothetical protein